MYLLQSVKTLNVYVLSNSQLRSTKITKCVLFQISLVRILFWVHEVGAWYLSSDMGPFEVGAWSKIWNLLIFLSKSVVLSSTTK